MAYTYFPKANPLIEEWDHPFNVLAPRRTTDYVTHATYDYGIKADACSCGDSKLTVGSKCGCNQNSSGAHMSKGPIAYPGSKMAYHQLQKPTYKSLDDSSGHGSSNKAEYYMKLGLAAVGIYLVYTYIM